MSTPSESTLLTACRLLFGDEVELCREFLASLQPDAVRTAYRARAKELHPDRFAVSPPEVCKRQNERFQELTRAYQLLRTYFGQREAGVRAGVQRTTGYQPIRGSGAEVRSCYPHPRVPAVPLEFGRFLFHRGKISYQELVAALLWQRRQRPSIGSIARRWGWLDEAKVNRVLQEHSSGRRFGGHAVTLGYLNPIQVQVLVRYQQLLHRKLGEYFVEQGILEAVELERLAEDHREHNRRLAP
jgi:DnaJ domain